VVVVEQATESLAPVHPSILVRRRGRALEQHVVETLVVPLGTSRVSSENFDPMGWRSLHGKGIGSWQVIDLHGVSAAIP
jgi:hypothetical protein